MDTGTLLGQNLRLAGFLLFVKPTQCNCKPSLHSLQSFGIKAPLFLDHFKNNHLPIICLGLNF